MRITGGEDKGRVIRLSKALLNSELRPTSHKVRKALFDILREKIVDADFLDLFSGTGAVGFEALSRGAKEITIVENKKKLIKNIKKFSQLIDKQVEIYCDDTLNFLKKTDKTFDIVFADPPYDYDRYEELFRILSERDIIREGGVFVIEHSSKRDMRLNKVHLDFIKTYIYGDTSLTFFR